MMVLVLLDRPEYLNIPYFAMPDPSSRENRFTRLNLNSVSKMVGRRCAAWLTEHRDKVEFITPPFQGNGGAITLVRGLEAAYTEHDSTIKNRSKSEAGDQRCSP